MKGKREAKAVNPSSSSQPTHVQLAQTLKMSLEPQLPPGPGADCELHANH